MCQSIKVLRNIDRLPQDSEVHEGVLQFVRKIGEYRQFSRANSDAFELSVDEIIAVSSNLLESLKQRPVARLGQERGELR